MNKGVLILTITIMSEPPQMERWTFRKHIVEELGCIAAARVPEELTAD